MANSFHRFSFLEWLTRSYAFWIFSLVGIALAANLTICSFATKKNFKKAEILRAKLDLISSEEKQELEYLFRHLMFHSSFAYVLFGDKPMSFENFIRTEKVWKHFMFSFTSFEQGLDYYKCQKGWEIWEKYKHLFPLSKFILAQQDSADLSGCTDIVLIHKDNFLKMMNRCSQDFKSVLGENFNPTEVLNCLSTPVYTLHRKLKRHSALLGILLGYGRENAWVYYSLNRLRTKAKKDPLISQELEIARAKFSRFDSLTNPYVECPIKLPMFMCNPQSKETQELREKYRKQRIEIYKKYQEDDFLVVTLLKLTEE